MKRFLIFFSQQYHPKGGMNDFINDFDSLDEAIRTGRSMITAPTQALGGCHLEVYDWHEKKVAYSEGTWNKVVNPKVTFNIALPHVAPKWNLEGFAMTVDPAYWKYFVISDHSKNQDVRAMGLEEKGARVTYNPEGSISSAWNRALKERTDFTIICSVSMRFYWGVERMIDEFRRNLNEWAAETQWGFHLCAVTRDLTDKVGLVDENFQAYAEDTDWRYRWNKAGLLTNRFNVSAAPIGLGIAMKTGEIILPSQRMDDYYKEKWGGCSGQEKFPTPYNDPTKDITYWRPPIK